MNAPYYGPDGTLYVWTGTGYQAIPQIAESDLAYNTGAPQSTTPSYVIPMGDGGSIEWGGLTTPSYNFVNPDAAQKYGSVAGMNVSDNNFRIQDATPEGFTLLLKSGDKEGTKISYTLKDGQWVPTVTGTQAFDTNAEGTADFKGLGSVFAAPFIQTGLQELTGVSGVAPSFGTYGPGIDAGLAAYDAGMLTAGAGTGAANVGTFANGLQEPIAPNLFDASQWPGAVPPANGLQEPVAPNLGDPSQWPQTAPPANGLQEPVAPDLGDPSQWPQTAPPANGLQEPVAPDLGDPSQWAGAPPGLTPEVMGALGLTPEILKKLGPEAIKLLLGLVGNNQQEKYGNRERDATVGAADDYKEAGMLYARRWQKFLDENDPDTVAKKRYDEMQALAAPGREIGQQGLLQKLYNKGGYGLSLNTPTLDANGKLTEMAVNPYVSAFASANNKEDRQMAYDAWGQGQKWLDDSLRRQDVPWRAERGSTQDYITTVLGANNKLNGDNAVSSSYTYGTLGGLPWGTIWDSLGGLFGSKT